MTPWQHISGPGKNGPVAHRTTPRERVKRLELKPEQLRHRLDPAPLHFRTTEDLQPLENTIGQPRAFDAIDFGMENSSPGYKLFVSGAPGSGRLSAVRGPRGELRQAPPGAARLGLRAQLGRPDRPRAIRLPAGRGRQLAAALDSFIEAVVGRQKAIRVQAARA